MHVSVIIAAGGHGRRFGAPVPKQLLVLGGRTILQRTVEAFLSCRRVTDVIVVAPRDLADDPPDYLREPRVSVVPGGERRQDSVARGFDALAPEAEIVLIHDAARPFVDEAIVDRAIDAAAETGAAIAAVPASDTVKWSPPGVAGGGDRRFIDRTLARGSVFLAQTPQAFRRSVLADAVALGRGGMEATDEAALAERAGHRVELVEGSRRNIKITTPDDLVFAEVLVNTDESRAEALLHSSQTEVRDSALGTRDSGLGMSHLRIGTGYDLHRLAEGRPLVLGGVTIPFERGLEGHSDADVLCHALTDAILGAAAMGDIGQHFPDTDPRWKDVSSLDLLSRAVALAGGRGFSLVNADVTLIAERPKIGPHRDAIVARLCDALGVTADRISVKAKTNEGVDASGRGEAMAAHAVALLERRAASREPRSV